MSVSIIKLRVENHPQTGNKLEGDMGDIDSLQAHNVFLFSAEGEVSTHRIYRQK